MVYATEMATSDLCLACGESAVKKDRRVLGGSDNTSEQVTAKTLRSNIPAMTGLIVLTPSSLNALARRFSFFWSAVILFPLQFPGSDHIPYDGNTLMDALFQQRIVIGSLGDADPNTDLNTDLNTSDPNTDPDAGLNDLSEPEDHSSQLNSASEALGRVVKDNPLGIVTPSIINDASCTVDTVTTGSSLFGNEIFTDQSERASVCSSDDSFEQNDLSEDETEEEEERVEEQEQKESTALLVRKTHSTGNGSRCGRHDSAEGENNVLHSRIPGDGKQGAQTGDQAVTVKMLTNFQNTRPYAMPPPIRSHVPYAMPPPIRTHILKDQNHMTHIRSDSAAGEEFEEMPLIGGTSVLSYGTSLTSTRQKEMFNQLPHPDEESGELRPNVSSHLAHQKYPRPGQDDRESGELHPSASSHLPNMSHYFQRADNRLADNRLADMYEQFKREVPPDGDAVS